VSRWSRPEPLASVHDTEHFDCSDPVLDQWLKRYALTNHRSGAARVFLSAAEDDRVAGYYCLSTASAPRADLPARAGHGMPQPVPLILLGRLAVDVAHQRSGLGAGLLRDAIQRTLIVADSVGVRALITHAANPSAAEFYAHFGFAPSPTDRLHLVLMLKDARAVIGQAKAAD
jgi:GNAT superfamily N-acetyltransferase